VVATYIGPFAQLLVEYSTGAIGTANVLEGASRFTTAIEPSSRSVAINWLPSGVTANPENCFAAPCAAGYIGAVYWFEFVEKTSIWLFAAR
jgi:hypothetical protein